MSSSAKQQRSVCVLLPNKEQLDVAVGPKSTGLDVFSRVAETLRITDVHFFGLTVVKDNEHVFLDLEQKLSRYFPKLKKQDTTQGIGRRPPPLLLFFKVQFYVENGRLICERKARRLYFTELRNRVLRSECRQQEAVYFQLAGYAMQAQLGDRPPQADPGDPSRPERGPEAPPYFQPKDYFPPWILAKRGPRFLLRHGPELHGELRGLSARDAALLFIKESCRLEDVPVTFYRLHKDKKEERGSALLGLTLQGMQVYQEQNNTLQLLYNFPWSNVGRLAFLGKRFEIQPDGLPSARKLVFYTGSPFRSRHLLLHLSSSHRLHLSLQPALRHLHQLEDSEEKERYRESYISYDPDLDPGSDGSLSGRSTGSSGIEVDVRQPGVSVEEEEEVGGGHHEGVQNEEGGSQTEEVLVDDPDHMVHLADLLQGVAVDPHQLERQLTSPTLRSDDTQEKTNAKTACDRGRAPASLRRRATASFLGRGPTRHVPPGGEPPLESIL